MKRFLIISLVILGLVVGAYFVFFRTSTPIDLHRGEEQTVAYRVSGKTVERLEDDGYQAVDLRAVELSSFVAGHHASDYAATEEDYARWLGQIAELGANAVAVTNIMDDEFYDALLEHNESGDSELLLVQGITVLDSYEDATESAYESGLMKQLEKWGKVAVDAIHGARDVAEGGVVGGGSFRSDVSRWVAALIIAEDFNVDTVAYTNHSPSYAGSYEGSYYATSPEATAFEAMLAQVMDEIAAYEAQKYDTQRPCGFVASPLCDPLEYEELYARQLGKYVSVNAEHVVPGEKNQAGRIGAYRTSDVVGDFASYLTQECRESVASLLAGLDKKAMYGGYLQFLASYHSMPLLGLFSVSTARVPSVSGEEALDECAQGEEIVRLSDAFAQAGWWGQAIAGWQDRWESRSWNTAFATTGDNAHLWHDLQAPAQNEGLMAFEPGEQDVCVIDGKPDEWWISDAVVEHDGLKLSARSDAEAMYLLVEGMAADDVLYVPLDVSIEVGVESCDDPALSFSDKAEFVLCVDGAKNSRLLVQEHCDATRAMYLRELTGADPYVNAVSASDATFGVVQLAQANPALLSKADYLAGERAYLGLYDAGALVCGNGDPEAENYCSLTDICFGDGCVELRLPWLLLNIGDPSNMLAHRDYYDHFGVEFKKTKKIGMGVARSGKDEPIELADYAVHGWKKLKVRERLKQSYAIVQAAWAAGR